MHYYYLLCLHYLLLQEYSTLFKICHSFFFKNLTQFICKHLHSEIDGHTGSSHIAKRPFEVAQSKFDTCQSESSIGFITYVH